MDLTGNEDKLLLTKQMRIATREIHNLSDALVNSKLVFGKNYNFNEQRKYHNEPRNELT